MELDLTFSQALDGYLLAAYSRRLSEHTLADYTNTFRKLTKFLGGDLILREISSEQVQEFLASQSAVSKKTLLNYHTGLSALWTWAATEGLVKTNVVREVEPPRPERRAIKSYSEDDVRAMLKASEYSREYRRLGQRAARNRLDTATRNKAIVLILLDTGVRADELCRARLGDMDLRNKRLRVMGKGAKERIVPICAETGKIVWRYLMSRPEADRVPGRPLFVDGNGRRIGRDDLYHLLRRIGERAGVRSVTVHRFRHTFAIQFLRNGGNPWALQMAMGHSSMTTVRRYLELAQADVEAAHELASPVANWRL